MGQIEWSSEEVILSMRADLQNNSFYAVDADGTELLVAKNVHGGFLGTETCGGFVGLLASGNGSDKGNYAEFDWFEYRGK